MDRFLHRRLVWKPVALAIFILGIVPPAVADDPTGLLMPYGLLDDSAVDASDEDRVHSGPPGEGEGDVEIVRERYPNGNVKIERGVTWDAEGNYVNHGEWTMWSPTGAVVAEGKFDMGQRVGLWRRYVAQSESPVLNEFPFNRFKAPFMSQANFRDGAMDGEWSIIDANERKCMQISIRKGQRHGPAITWLPTGKTYRQATYDQGVPVGDVMAISNKSGELERVASYVDGRKVVTATTYHNRGRQKKTEAMYLAATTVQKSPDDFWNLRLAEYVSEGEDLRHGPAKGWYENGRQREEGFYQHDKKAGTFTYWYSNGQIAATGEFKEDQPHGMWVWYHENGLKAAIGKSQEGKLLGEWRWWNEGGRLIGQKTYDGTQNIASGPQLDVLELGQRETDNESLR